MSFAKHSAKSHRPSEIAHNGAWAYKNTNSVCMRFKYRPYTLMSLSGRGELEYSCRTESLILMRSAILYQHLYLLSRRKVTFMIGEIGSMIWSWEIGIEWGGLTNEEMRRTYHVFSGWVYNTKLSWSLEEQCILPPYIVHYVHYLFIIYNTIQYTQCVMHKSGSDWFETWILERPILLTCVDVFNF